jgi:hypothetical protein
VEEESGSEPDTTSGRKSRTSKTKKPGKKIVRRPSMPESQLAAMQGTINAEKAAILASKDLEESEKNKIVEEAEKRLKELEKEREARAEVAAKLAQLEQKLLVGGVNILDQHQQQQIMLAKKAQELEEGLRKQSELESHLDAKEEMSMQIEEEFTNLQEGLAKEIYLRGRIQNQEAQTIVGNVYGPKERA